MVFVNDTATELDKQEDRLCKAPPPLARSLARCTVSLAMWASTGFSRIVPEQTSVTGDQTAPHDGAACDEGRGAPPPQLAGKGEEGGWSGGGGGVCHGRSPLTARRRATSDRFSGRVCVSLSAFNTPAHSRGGGGASEVM